MSENLEKQVMNKYNAAAWRQAAPEPDESEIIDLKLPSGFVVKATRPPLELWVMSGAVPIDLIDKAVSVHAAHSPEDREEKKRAVEEVLRTDPEAAKKANTFMRDAVMQAVVRPRIVLEADPNNPDEMALRDIPPKDFNAILLWVMTGSTGIPVKTTNGKGTTVQAVETFPHKSGVPGSRKNVRQVRGSRKRKARHQ